MGGFDDREKLEESGFSYSQELEFKIYARRARLLGLWAAEKIGLTGQDAENYAKTVVSSDLKEPGHQDLLDKIRADFSSHEVSISDHRLKLEAQKMYEIAKKQILTGE
ncbi:MAG: DUF1476 domain-containing protein [Alphaproteobacteria bacterium]|jgi:hypothetical protein|nr:DUF1476 domain-containing protein [Alphaproteobacteria bacterium]MBP9877636.1 DUF1476 domain-containing protein [Alphaproteobacteria bacterium]